MTKKDDSEVHSVLHKSHLKWGMTKNNIVLEAMEKEIEKHPFGLLPKWKAAPFMLEVARSCKDSIKPIKLESLGGLTLGIDADTLFEKAVKKCTDFGEPYRDAVLTLPYPIFPESLVQLTW